MRDKFKNKAIRYLAYKKEQNIWRKTFFRIFPKKYTHSLEKIQSAILDLSSRCNLECPFCTNRFRKTGIHMSYEKAVEYFHKLPRSIRSLHLHFSGESFLNPEISKIIGFLSSQGLFLSVSTNGTLPSERYIQTVKNGVNELIFAVDGATPETHEKYRRGSKFHRVMETLSEVLKQKQGKAKVGVQFLVTKFNENEIEDMRELLKKMGADFFHLKTISLDIASNETLEGERLKNAREFLPSNEKYSRYHFDRKSLKLKYPIAVCPFIFEPVIGADGEVALCCIDLEKQVKVGNLNDYASFEELWNTENYRSLRKKVLNKELALCKKCNFCLIGLKEVKI